MIVPPFVDIDRLHATIEQLEKQEHRGRQEGKTVAYLMLMLGEVELGGATNTYLYVGESTFFTAQAAKSFAKLIRRELPDIPVELSTSEKVVINGTQTFLFISAPAAIQNTCRIRGLSIDRVFVDLDDATQHRLDHDGELTRMFQQLMIQLSYKRGDVV